MDALTDQKRLIDRLVHVLDATGGSVSQFETHISRVLIAGKYAFKFKKALRLPFLDFSTLDARRFYCQEECRLNRRLAPHIYIDVVPVTGDIEHPVVGGAGEAIEYAVRMHAFEQQALWSFRIDHNLLTIDDIEDFAPRMARFHLNAALAPLNTGWGTAQAIATTSGETFAELSELVVEDDDRDHLSALRKWEAEQPSSLAGTFQLRKAQGMIRECHGDLHCGNVLTANGQAQVFDCIEFNDSLRWIDVMNDLAFIHMDLAFHGRPDLAARLLNRYLEITGDYPGLAVLRYYRVHRALVRAKVMLLRACQPDMPAGEEEAWRRDGSSYLRCARQCSEPTRVAVMITYGYSGSGKTTFARHLVQLFNAIQVRSDVERKRLYGIPETCRASTTVREPLYGDAATQRTYEQLATLARGILAAGWPVIVDAGCLAGWQRRMFLALATEMSVPFFIFDIRASWTTMTDRILAREKIGLDASDAGVAILERQVRNAEPLTPEEMAHAIVVGTETGMNLERARDACAPVLAILGHRTENKRP